MRIILINPPSNFFPGAHGGLYPPFGLLAIGSAWKRLGHNIKIVDAVAQKIEPVEIIEQALTADLVGVSCNLDNFPVTQEIINGIKKTDNSLPIICGGPFASVAPTFFYRNTKANWICAGEGETINPQELLKTRTRTIKPQGKGSFVNLDQHPLDYSLIDLGVYLKEPIDSIPSPCPTTMTSRGCPFSCDFCASGYLNNIYRVRSLESVDQELKFYKKNWEVKAIQFVDGTFTVDKKRTLDICQLLRSHQLPWSCNTRVDCLNEELIKAMAKSGCLRVRLGIESFEDGILKSSHKGISLEDNIRIINLLKKYGIEPSAFLLFGLPGQTQKTLEVTWEMIQELKIITAPNMVCPIPGTPLYQNARAKGKLPSLFELATKFYPRHNQNTTKGARTSGFNLSEIPDEEIVAFIEKINGFNESLKTTA